jgi:hypothetical protein
MEDRYEKGPEVPMKTARPIRALFLDIGGGLVADGWNHEARGRAAKAFDLALNDIKDRHCPTFHTSGVANLTLAEYLTHVVFYQQRRLRPGRFREIRFRKAKPFPEMIEFVCRLVPDVAQVPMSRVVAVEDRPMFVKVAESLGIYGIHHTDSESTPPRWARLDREVEDDQTLA